MIKHVGLSAQEAQLRKDQGLSNYVEKEREANSLPLTMNQII